MTLVSRLPMPRVYILAIVISCAYVVASCVGWTGGVESALGASTPSPSLRVTVGAFPTVLHPTPGKKGKYTVALENVGAASSVGEITVKAHLPSGLTIQNVFLEPGGAVCSPAGGSEVTCTISESIVPSGFFTISIYFEVSGGVGAGPLVGRVDVSGGGSSPASGEASMYIGGAHETGPAGVAHFEFEATGPAGEPATQASGHPNFLTTSLLLNNINAEALSEPYQPVQESKDLVFYLPLGLLGDPTVSALCPASLVETAPNETGCPPSSRIGTVLPMILSNVFAPTSDPTHEFGVYNIVPEKGYAAEFAFASLGYTFVSYASVVRRDGTYMLRVSTPGVPTAAKLTGLIATFYGDVQERYVSGFEERVFDRGAFLTDPSDCGEGVGAREASVALNTWEDPDPSLPFGASAVTFPAVDGCGSLRFGAGLDVRPESTQADEPSGFEVGLDVPQAPNGGSGFYGDVVERYVSGFEERVFDRGAFLTDPSDCGEGVGAREASVALNTWEDPDPSLPLGASAVAFPVVDGCGSLRFGAGLDVRPESTQADEPSGFEVGLDVPQAPNGGSGLGTPPVKSVELEFPEGASISPASANGLVACQEFGSSGIDIEGPESEADGPDGLPRPVAGHCPFASQVATVTGNSPLLREALTGHLFIASPHCGGAGQHACTEADAADGELFGVFLELEAPNAGVVIKMKGSAEIDPVTGRVKAVFKDAPQFPFSNLTVALKRGPRAPFENPQACGVATSEGVVEPWSEPTTPAAKTSSSYRVDWDGAGGGCPASTPFTPSFLAETKNPSAGGFSSFVLGLGRGDREQNVASLSTLLPEGLLAAPARVGRCPVGLASVASLSACPVDSQVGSVSVAVGSGSEPYWVSGKVFFTGPYGGAPFGLTVVVPAAAGPFNLGVVLVRAAVFIDPHTAQATIVSGAFPQILDGVPLRLRDVDVSVDAHEFMVNPTGCGQLSVTGVVHSTSGGSASVASPFAASGCKNLGFGPVLSGSTEARSTKTRGTGVRVKIGYPSSGAQSNIAKVVVGFPKALPVRLTTLQRACRAVVFEANPAGCPAASNIGTSTARTPLLGVPLSGPTYLVSYGSAKFPDVVMVLQGEGVTLEVDGQSFVSHSGALRVTFANVPDAPVSSFETVLPAGPFSQFTSVRSTGRAVASQCGEKLAVPVTMVSHSGREVKQSVKLKITGCKASRRRAAGKRKG